MTFAKQLKIRFPDIEIGLVRHGLEQFSLLEHNENSYPELPAEIESVVADEGVPVIVCGVNTSPCRRDAFRNAPDKPHASLGYVLVTL